MISITVSQESFTETPFHPAKVLETTMSRKLLSEGYAQAKPIEHDEMEEEYLEDVEEDDAFSSQYGYGTSTSAGTLTDEMVTLPDDEIKVAVARWMPPRIRAEDWKAKSIKIRVTFVDGAFQIYGHQKSDKHILRSVYSTCFFADFFTP